jgi:RNA polymerase primary sigma factor
MRRGGFGAAGFPLHRRYGTSCQGPVHIQDTARKLLRERTVEEARLGRLETEFETARRIGMPVGKTRMLLAMFEDTVSLDEVDPDSGLSSVDSLCDEMALDPADVADRRSLRRTLFNMLDGLDSVAGTSFFCALV